MKAALLKALGDEMKEESKVKRVVAFKPSWEKAYEDMKSEQAKLEKFLEKMQEEALKQVDAYDKLKKRFWRTVELDLDEYGSMQINPKDHTIEILES